jgi:hypothetical protein
MKSIDIASRLSDGQIQALPRHTKIQPQASKHPKKLKMSDLRGAEKTVFYFLIKNMQRLVGLVFCLIDTRIYSTRSFPSEQPHGLIADLYIADLHYKYKSYLEAFLLSDQYDLGLRHYPTRASHNRNLAY